MRLAGLLRDLGITKGDRVATLAWNSHRHLEVYGRRRCPGRCCTR